MLVAHKSTRDEIAQTAWLYYVGNLSQQEISKRMGVSRFKVLRMLADARERGLVRISIEHRTSTTLLLADRLAKAFDLREVQVAPQASFDDDTAGRRAVGILAAAYLARVASSQAPTTVGIGWGRTLSAMADSLTGVSNPHLTFVSIMGSVSHASPTAPGDVCIRLAAETGGRAMLLPAPFVTDSAEACATVMEQRLVRDALDLARKADHALLSVGECQDGAILFQSNIFSPEQLQQLRDAKVVGDCCGVFFPADGKIPDIELNHCTPGVRAHDMQQADTVVLASGTTKTAATLAVLRAGFVKRLLVDEALALALLDQHERGS